MIIIHLRDASAQLHGRVSRFLIEPIKNLFVGSVPETVKEELWKIVCDEIGDGACVLVYQKQNKIIVKYGGKTDRFIVDFDGLSLIGQAKTAHEENPKK